jgi:ABC-type nitrate/sulfonate/bicarbonate transport system substrate-binding protein
MAVPASQVFPVPARRFPLAARPRVAGEFNPSGAMLIEQNAALAIAERSGGAATRLVGVSRVEDFQGLIVARHAGLRRGRDLRDRRIGLPARPLQGGAPRVHALRAATAVLESEGLFFRHVQWVDLPPAEAVSLTLPTAYSAEIAALQAGTVDAVYVRGPAGLEAARAAGAQHLVDLSAPRDPWLKAHTALLQARTVRDSLLVEHPQVIAELFGLDTAFVGAMETLKTFMIRWAFISMDFKIGAWTHGTSDA